MAVGHRVDLVDANDIRKQRCNQAQAHVQCCDTQGGMQRLPKNTEIKLTCKEDLHDLL